MYCYGVDYLVDICTPVQRHQNLLTNQYHELFQPAAHFH